MKTQNQSRHGSSSGRNFIGLIIILIGGLLLIDRLLPALHLDWLFSWPMLFIVLGFFIGAQSKFENAASYILIGLGGFFLLNNHFDFRIGNLMWPLILIFFGFWLIRGRSRDRSRKNRSRPASPNPQPDEFIWDKRVQNESDTDKSFTQQPSGERENEPQEEEKTNWQNNQSHYTNEHSAYSEDKEDFIDSTSIFGDAKHYIVSEQFMGGDIVNIMGGATINLMRADLKGPATLEVVQLFGGTTIIAPAHWVIKPEMSSVFGGIEDKRFQTPSTPDYTKILYLKGTSIFGGITIKSY